MAKFRSTTISTTGVNVTSKGCDVTFINVINRHSAVIYVKFYDSDVATFQDTPVRTIAVAASGGQYVAEKNRVSLVGVNNGLTLRVSTDNTDNGNTAAATLPIIELEYND